MKKIFDDRLVNLGFSVALFFNIIHIMVLILLYPSLPPLLPLYNQLPWGEPRLGTKFEFFIPFIIVISLFFINIFLTQKFYDKMPLVARILSQTSLLISFLALFFIIRTILLIT